ncbi:hypothetical protein [Erythrobacter ani]|uniref:Uncharacterized protein n=1 Tax=Erythrobacter ani TaxID=2827235 RepID=A0ABS6SKU9_9SPHN|nr:hypothetical protein [Erythrobacter ani]MBV7265491.1 hypothetical protein [Erythrobacter ani]
MVASSFPYDAGCIAVREDWSHPETPVVHARRIAIPSARSETTGVSGTISDFFVRLLIVDQDIPSGSMRFASRSRLQTMPWRLIRLEHAPTIELPTGSPVRTYLLRLPLKVSGHIDADIHSLNPLRSTMRRFWPSKPDRSGYVTRAATCWQLVTKLNAGFEDTIGRFEDCAFVLAAPVSITERRNGTIPFEVIDIRLN